MAQELHYPVDRRGILLHSLTGFDSLKGYRTGRGENGEKLFLRVLSFFSVVAFSLKACDESHKRQQPAGVLCSVISSFTYARGGL